VSDTGNPQAEIRDREVRWSRVVDAPRDRAFMVWTDPEYVARWWGPRGMDCPECVVDLRPGGRYAITMCTADGTDYPTRGEVLEVTPPERLVLSSDVSGHPPQWRRLLETHVGEMDYPRALRNTITATFEEQGNRTALGLRIRFETNRIRDGYVKLGIGPGWSESLDRFAEELIRSARTGPGEGHGAPAQSLVVSRDGTTIAFERSGRGPPVILVAAALADRAGTTGLARLLSGSFTVINYDRRGRGRSTDTPPYATEREVEDLDALIASAGGSACLFGSSSGAVLALEAAARLGAKCGGLVMYEPPFIVDGSRPPVPEDLASRVQRLVDSGRRSDALELFFTEGMGIPAPFVTQMRTGMAIWPGMVDLAHTIPYDLALLAGTQSGKPLPVRRFAGARAPTLVVVGSQSEPYFHAGARELVGLLPDGRYRSLEGRDHSALMTAPEDIAAAIASFHAERLQPG
jgi:uncharacterized protein YndB with AHSA1/START domain/pimeloyl-ACP methyl ester carboxylesterase